MRNAADILESAYDVRDEITICLIGDPGIGKTQVVYDLARKKGVNVVEIIASQILPNEVSGITMPNEDTKSMEVFDHARLSSLKDGDILFFDELLQAAPSTLSACLTLIQERRMMSGKKLPDIMIVAATNPIIGGSKAIPPAVRQRFMWVECEWDINGWCMYIEGKYNIKAHQIAHEVDQAIHSVVHKDDYNLFTPRSAEKLIRWVKDSCVSDTELRRIWASSHVRSVMDAVRMLDREKMAKHAMIDATLKVTNGINPDYLESLNLQDLLAYLKKLSNWKLIEEELSNTEMI